MRYNKQKGKKGFTHFFSRLMSRFRKQPEKKADAEENSKKNLSSAGKETPSGKKPLWVRFLAKLSSFTFSVFLTLGVFLIV